jgi:predicted nucleotidyltransferase
MSKTTEKIFGSRIRAKILGWLFTHPEESFFVRQMASILKEDPTNVSLILKTAGVAGRIRAALERLAGIEYAFIYGSYAKGDEKTDSDVDLLILGDVDMDHLDSNLVKLEKMLGREINYVLYDMDEFKAKKKANDGFLRDVLKGKKIMVVGTEHGLEAP